MSEAKLKTERALGLAKDFVEELTKIGGKYPEINKTRVVADAYKTLKEIEEALEYKPSRGKVIADLQYYNVWRRGGDDHMLDAYRLTQPHPTELGKTIDRAIELLKQPTMQWVEWREGMGIPEYKLAIQKWKELNGKIYYEISTVSIDYEWEIDEEENNIMAFMIIE